MALFPRRCAGRILALDALGLVSLRGADSGNRPVGGAQITPAGLYCWLISIGPTSFQTSISSTSSVFMAVAARSRMKWGIPSLSASSSES
jgi:hypothetical protein